MTEPHEPEIQEPRPKRQKKRAPLARRIYLAFRRRLLLGIGLAMGIRAMWLILETWQDDALAGLWLGLAVAGMMWVTAG